VAAEAARLLAAAGETIDVHLVQIAALLHDIDKLETRRGGEPHGILGARWLTERGYPELAGPVASHPFYCLLDPERAPRGWAAKLVSIADRRVAQRFVSIDERIDDLAARFPDDRAGLEAARAPAAALQAELADRLGISADELDRSLRAAWERDEGPLA
jgi:putative nucleotidyltransferase with HDIG domain